MQWKTWTSLIIYCKKNFPRLTGSWKRILSASCIASNVSNAPAQHTRQNQEKARRHITPTSLWGISIIDKKKLGVGEDWKKGFYPSKERKSRAKKLTWKKNRSTKIMDSYLDETFGIADSQINTATHKGWCQMQEHNICHYMYFKPNLYC